MRNLFSLCILGVEGKSAQSNVEFLGFKDDVFSHLSQSDVLLSCSLYREGVPRTTLEAISVGVPVIAFDLPGAKEGVVSNLNGFIVEHDIDAQKLAKLLIKRKEAIKSMRGIFVGSDKLKQFRLSYVLKEYCEVFSTL